MTQITDVYKDKYTNMLEYYKNNKDKYWTEWLDLHTIFERPGKQGLVGLMKSKIESANMYIFKISQYINYLAEHEYAIMSSLNSLSAYCPHFCKVFGMISCKVDPKYRKNQNPFDITTKYPIEKQALLCEYVDKSSKFYNYIKATETIPEDYLYSTIKQVLLAICIAQEKKRFTHYDLHSFNVMMKKCNSDMVFLYILDKDNQFVIPTYGQYPVIIDFGFSYIKDMDDGPLWPSMGHTNVGFTSDRYDWVADPKLFLVTVSSEIKSKRNTKKSKKFRRVVRNIFSELEIDWSSGWDLNIPNSASDYVSYVLSDCNKKSALFDEYEHYCLDLIQSIIILPLQPQEYRGIRNAFKIFINEFSKIESQITSLQYLLYILKGICDIARDIHADYIDPNTKLSALRTFRHRFHDTIQKVSNFCRLDGINYDKMLSSLYTLAKCIEGVLYDVMTTDKTTTKKYDSYKRLPFNNTKQIFGAIEANFHDDYVYTKNTKVCIVDSLEETPMTVFNIPKKHIGIINDMNPMTRGTYLYDLYKSHGFF